VILWELKGKAFPDDWKRTNIRSPRAPNVDVGRNSTAMISELRVSARTLEDVHAECGDNWKQKMQQRAAEIAYARELGKTLGLEESDISQLTGTEARQGMQKEEGTNDDKTMADRK
jgi:capsid protein